MELIAIVALLALLEYNVFGILVGRARGLYGIEAPAVQGHPIFERYFRVHQNTLEQIVVFLPCLWLFGRYLNPSIGAGLGLIWIAGRFLYLRAYVEEPSKRGLGTAVSGLASLVLLLGGLVGAASAWFR
ncbi:MAG: MAPEG family protein [Myxococcota bacterium]